MALAGIVCLSLGGLILVFLLMCWAFGRGVQNGYVMCVQDFKEALEKARAELTKEKNDPS